MASASAEALAAKHNAEVRAKKEGTPGVGHNSAPTTAEVLKSYLDRLVAIKEEQKAAADDGRDLKKEAKEHGVDPQALEVLAKRQMEDADKTAKREALAEKVDSYSVALGLLL